MTFLASDVVAAILLGIACGHFTQISASVFTLLLLLGVSSLLRVHFRKNKVLPLPWWKWSKCNQPNTRWLADHPGERCRIRDSVLVSVGCPVAAVARLALGRGNPCC